jgi:hypothetical protein
MGGGKVGFAQLCPHQPEARGREEIVGERLRLGGLKLRERGGTGGSLEKVKLTGGPGLSAGERKRGRGRRPAGLTGPKVRRERRVLFIFFSTHFQKHFQFEF